MYISATPIGTNRVILPVHAWSGTEVTKTSGCMYGLWSPGSEGSPRACMDLCGSAAGNSDAALGYGTMVGGGGGVRTLTKSLLDTNAGSTPLLTLGGVFVPSVRMFVYMWARTRVCVRVRWHLCVGEARGWRCVWGVGVEWSGSWGWGVT